LQHAELKDTYGPRRAAVGATVDRVNAAVAQSRRAAPRRRWGRVPRKVWIAAAAAVGWVAAAVILYTGLGWNSGPNHAAPPPRRPNLGPQTPPLGPGRRLAPAAAPEGHPAPAAARRPARDHLRRGAPPRGAAERLRGLPQREHVAHHPGRQPRHRHAR